jgi:hypothetical protein
LLRASALGLHSSAPSSVVYTPHMH